MHKKTFVICGESDTVPDFAAIGNNPNFVFQNDPDFETVRLFDQSGNIVNVNVTGLPTDPIAARRIAQNIQRELNKLAKDGRSGIVR